MKASDRHKKIEAILREKGDLSVAEIAVLTGVSEATVRRDLIVMEQKQMISRFWGGAKISDSDEMAPDYIKDENILRYSKYYNTKKELAKYAASLIPDGSYVFIDAGSTLYHMFEYITAKDIVVVTNNIYNLQVLAQKKIETFIPQGFVNFGAAAIISAETALALSEINYDIAFLGTQGIDERAGYSSSDNYDSGLKKMVAKQAIKTYVVSDASKFGKKKLFKFAELNSVTLITNEQPPFSINDCIVVR